MAYLSYIFDKEIGQYINIGGSDYTKTYYDTTNNWNLKRDLISQKNTIYVYTDGSSQVEEDGTVVNISAIKVGDGNTYLIDLPLITTSERTIRTFVTHMNNNDIHLQEGERVKWNQKCRVDESQTESGVLILTND